ncbi:MAG: HAMP domain-containing protein [Proteobacteria bacterium]|nr:HAMP domain-containing protein [Pseudomonadota bacterium]
MNLRSLSVRLVAWYAGVLTLVFVLLGALTYLFLRHYLDANLIDNQARRARQIADTLIAQAQPPGEAQLGAEVERLYSPEANDRFIRITRAGGAVVYVSGPPKDAQFDPLQVPAAAGSGRGGKLLLPGGSLLVAAAEARSPQGTLYRVEVGTAGAASEATLRRVLVMLAIGLPLAVAAAVAGGFVLVRRALLPVEYIALKAEQISQHNLSERLPVERSGDEIEQLSVSLNSMIARLEDALRSTKQFVADASHELRTPLTVMRGELEALAQDPGLGGEERERLGSVLEEVDRLAEIVEGLLSLSRLDAGESASDWGRVDLGALAADTADQMSLLALDKRISLVCEAAPRVHVDGDRARLKQVIVNLLDNAIKYTPPGGSVHLGVHAAHDQAVLEVRDTGIGIPPEALADVFKRFYRVDEARSREPGGAGLGLSIVKAICAAHGAQVEVTSGTGAGSTFCVRQRLARGTAGEPV